MMNNNDLKDFINEQLIIQYKINIGLNSTKLRKSWFQNSGYIQYYNSIMIATDFLSNGITIGERIYCIIHDIDLSIRCVICNRLASFSSFVEGYRITCGNKKCYIPAKKDYKDENGETANDRTIRKTTERLKNEPSIIKYRAKKMAITRSNNGSFKSGAIKGAKTKMETIEENGLSIAQNAALKSANTMKQTLMDDGKTLEQHRIEKTESTKKSKIINGLDGYERGFLNGAGRNSSIKYYNEDLYYQGTYEKHFLDLMTGLIDIKNIKRGPRVYYIDTDDIKRQYRADFKIGKYVYEIKSCWTYDHSKKDKKRRMNNKRKMKALKTAGYIPIIVYNKEIWYTYNDVITAKYLK